MALPDGGIIAEWPLNKRGESVRVSIEKYRGADLINIRRWYLNDDDVPCPGKGGIALNVKHLPQLAAALNGAVLVAEGCGLLKVGAVEVANGTATA